MKHGSFILQTWMSSSTKHSIKELDNENCDPIGQGARPVIGPYSARPRATAQFATP